MTTILIIGLTISASFLLAAVIAAFVRSGQVRRIRSSHWLMGVLAHPHRNAQKGSRATQCLSYSP